MTRSMTGEAASASARVAAQLLHVRWFVRAPIWIYRARLGVLFGSRLLMLEHIGRSTGHRRHIVVESARGPAPLAEVTRRCAPAVGSRICDDQGNTLATLGFRHIGRRAAL